jgi:predicted esterase
MKRVERNRCLIFVPDGDGPHPVLCFLHGAGEAATDKNGNPQPLAKLLANGSPAWHADHGSPFVSRFLVICPQRHKRGRWTSSDAAWVDDVVEEAANEHSGDLARLVLTGFSYGGEGAFHVAPASRLNWPTIWSVDPALQPSSPAPPATTRVRIDHGDEQPGGEHMAAFAAKLGIDNLAGSHAGRLIIKLDANHAETSVRAYRQPQVYDWLVA